MWEQHRIRSAGLARRTPPAVDRSNNAAGPAASSLGRTAGDVAEWCAHGGGQRTVRNPGDSTKHGAPDWGPRAYVFTVRRSAAEEAGSAIAFGAIAPPVFESIDE